MKKYVLFLSACLVLALAAFTLPGKPIVGKWKASFGNGVKGWVVFKSNGTFETTFTDITWKVGGNYKVADGMVYLSDTSCNASYWGKYKSTFYTDDSVGVTVVEDTCAGRKANADGSIMVRLK